MAAFEEWLQKSKGDVSSLVNTGLTKKICNDLKRDIPARDKKNMLRILKSLIKRGISGKEIEEGIVIVMMIEEEAEKKISECEREDEREEWDRVSEEANNVIRSWRKSKKEAMTYKAMKEEEEKRVKSKLEAQEKKITEEKEKEKQDALKKQADENVKAMQEREKKLNEQRAKEKEEAVKAKEKEMMEAQKKIEDELKQTKAERDKLKNQLPQGETFNQLSSIEVNYSDKSHFTISGNQVTKCLGNAYRTITFGPIMTTVCVYHSIHASFI